MKYLIASDLHGSHAWAEKLFDIFEKGDFDKLLLLGDIYYHGPRNPLPDGYNPQKLCEKLNGLKEKLLVVKGNCDAEVDQMISEFKLEDQIKFEIHGKKVFASHGQNYNIDVFPTVDFDVMFYGHFHTCFIKEKDGKIIVNPGSISLPKNGTPNSYAVMDENGICVFDFDGNVVDKINF